jgi:hypothetical protein
MADVLRNSACEHILEGPLFVGGTQFDEEELVQKVIDSMIEAA